MMGAVLKISPNKVQNRALTMPVENGLAAYVRNRWRTNTLCFVQEEWSLTESEARSVLYGHASRRTIFKIEQHKNGGIMLALDLLCIRLKLKLEDVAALLEERAADERDNKAAEVERWRRARRSLESRHSVVEEDRS